ncbi:hypothetical protein [Rhodopirellula sp. MGV]|uniref:hypothetical protein n=1 Tax=Rhodopirellula sp. MGV TaxID=2023130 RepID=UPI000B967C27|nr:hypothetical protein [Rhodopirellula sp. MGV]OYP36356.1 hypothetical protein CGZ80_08565 [Rhodopirellula sp. MGV]PNY38412.1 hypothetical protein C2E31_00215 [Rhodopirellula baltica]
MPDIRIDLVRLPETQSRLSVGDVNASQGFVLRTDHMVQSLTWLQDRFPKTRCVYLPTSRQDIRPAGLVVFLDEAVRKEQLPVGLIPLRRLSGVDSPRVWMPVDARLSARLPDVIQEDLYPKHFDDLVWLPDLGIVGFGSEDVVKHTDWIAAPASTSLLSWSSPPATDTLPTRLIELSSASFDQPNSFEVSMQEQFGSEEQPWWEAVESDGPKSGSGIRSKVTGWLLSKLDAMSEAVAKRKAKAAEQNRSMKRNSAAMQGAGRNDASITRPISAMMAMKLAAMLQGKREQQIEKLLKMLRDDPEKALQFAIPLGGMADAFRGFAMPGAALMSRLTDFSLGGLSASGGPVDAWSIGNQYQTKLLRSYRELANREVAAGKHRRAAYIYAHLLNDFRAAANALEQGRFYAEAATLHKDKLNSPRNAARCLALGGQFEKAAEIYLDLSEYELAGEAFVQGGDLERGNQAFESAYGRALARHALVLAAEILTNRLGKRKEAIELLCQQWPDGYQAKDTAELAIQWLGQDGQHEQTQSFAQRVLDQASVSQLPDVVAIFSQQCRRYPERLLRYQFDDHCRIAVARAMESDSRLVHDEVLKSLGVSSPGDRQLRRDCQIYGRRLKPSPSERVPSASRSDAITAVAKLKLQKLFHYSDFQVYKKQLIAVGIANGCLQVHRVPVGDPMPMDRYVKSGKVKLSSALGQHEPWIASTGLDRNDGVDAVRIYADTPCEAIEAAIPDDHIAPVKIYIAARREFLAAAGTIGKQEWIVFAANQSIVLADAATSFDLLQHLHAEDISLEDLSSLNVKLALVDEQPFVAIGNLLINVKGASTHCSPLDSDIRLLAGSPPRTRKRLLLATESMLELRYLDGQPSAVLCRDYRYDSAMMVPNGSIIAIENQTLHRFDVRDGVGSRVQSMRLPEPNPLKLLCVSAKLVAVAYTDGSVYFYRLA